MKKTKVFMDFLKSRMWMFFMQVQKRKATTLSLLRVSSYGTSLCLGTVVVFDWKEDLMLLAGAIRNHATREMI